VDKNGVVHFTDTPTDPKYFSNKEDPHSLPAAPRISLDCREMDILKIFQLISEAWGVEILPDKDIQGKVTLRLVNIPANRVLEKVLSERGLVKVQEGKTIYVTTPERAKIYEYSKRLSKREARFRELINRIMAEFDNKERGKESKELCADAVKILQKGFATWNNDEEFLSAVEKAIFNRTISIWPVSRKEFIVYPEGEASILLEKAKLIKGISDDAGDRHRKLQRKIEDLEDDLNATKAQIRIIR
jgi:hypothetical protein